MSKYNPGHGQKLLYSTDNFILWKIAFFEDNPDVAETTAIVDEKEVAANDINAALAGMNLDY